MPQISYDQIKQALESNAGLNLNPSDLSVTNAFAGNISLDVPQLPAINIPLDDLTYSTNIEGSVQDLNNLLSLKDANGSKVNNYAGSQVIINSDRLIFNARTDFLMLFGQTGVALASPGNINIDAEDSVTIFGEEGLFLGVPGKGEATKNEKAPQTKADPTTDNDYEPLVLGTKLANLIEDLIVVLKNATILTPVGKGYLREDVMYDLACLQARIPEILSTYGYIDGISHESVDPAPEPLQSATEPPTSITGTITGTVDGTVSTEEIGAGTDQIASPLTNQPDYFDTVDLYRFTI